MGAGADIVNDVSGGSLDEGMLGQVGGLITLLHYYTITRLHYYTITLLHSGGGWGGHRERRVGGQP